MVTLNVGSFNISSTRDSLRLLLLSLFIYFKICIHEVYTGVRTKGHNIPYKVQPPYINTK